MSRGMHYRSRYKLELTPRQREVLDLIAKGQTNAEIATRLDLTLDGVKWHVREILGKLSVDSREEAAALWRDYNRPAARLGRGLGGLLAFGTLKTAIAGAGLLAVGGAAVAVYLALHESGSGAKAEPTANAVLSGPPCTAAEVSIKPFSTRDAGAVLLWASVTVRGGGCVLNGEYAVEVAGTASKIVGNPSRAKFASMPFPELPSNTAQTVMLPIMKYHAAWSNWCGEPPKAEVRISIGDVLASAPLSVTPDCTGPGKPSELRLGGVPLQTAPPAASEQPVVIDDSVRAYAEQLAASVTGGDLPGVMALAAPQTFTCPSASPRPSAWPYPVCEGLSPGTKVDGYAFWPGTGDPQYVAPEAFEQAVGALPPLELASIACRAGESECTLDKTFVVGFKNTSGPAVFFVLNPTTEGPRISGMGQADDPRITAGGRLDIWPGSLFYVPLK